MIPSFATNAFEPASFRRAVWLMTDLGSGPLGYWQLGYPWRLGVVLIGPYGPSVVQPLLQFALHQLRTLTRVASDHNSDSDILLPFFEVAFSLWAGWLLNFTSMQTFFDALALCHESFIVFIVMYAPKNWFKHCGHIRLDLWRFCHYMGHCNA